MRVVGGLSQCGGEENFWSLSIKRVLNAKRFSGEERRCALSRSLVAIRPRPHWLAREAGFLLHNGSFLRPPGLARLAHPVSCRRKKPGCEPLTPPSKWAGSKWTRKANPRQGASRWAGRRERLCHKLPLRPK